MRLRLALILCLLWTSFASAQVVYDAVGNGVCNAVGGGAPECTSSGTVLTYSHTTTTSSNRAIAVGVCVSGSSSDVQPSISTVTYAGVSLTQKHHQGGNYYCDLWSLPDGTQPATGANNVVITLSGALVGTGSVITSAAITATGVDQATAWTSSANGNSGNGTSATLTISASGANDLGVHFECNGASVSTTVGANETSRFVATANTFGACNTLGAATATGGDTAFSRTVGSDNWIMIGGALKASTGSTPTTRRRYVY